MAVRVEVVLAALSLAACAPPDEPVAAACPDGQLVDEDAGGCVPAGCGSGTWGLLDRPEGALHVAPWGDDGDDGSAERPLRTVQEGADEAEGGLVVVAAGTYTENLVLAPGHDGLRLRGRCAELVSIDGSSEDVETIELRGGELWIEGVSVTGGYVGIRVERPGFGPEAELHLARATLRGNEGVGLLVAGSGAISEVEDARLLDTLPTAAGEFGRGISVERGGLLVGRRLWIEGSHEGGFAALGEGTRVHLEGSMIRDTQPLPDGSDGRGIEVFGAASFTGVDLVLEDNRDIGLLAADAGSSVELERVTIRNTRALDQPLPGAGLVAELGATLTGRELLLEGNDANGISIWDAGTTVELADSTVRDTQPWITGGGGRGVEVEAGGRLVADRLDLVGNRSVGLVASGFGTSVELTDCAVLDTSPLPDGSRGRGVEVYQDASLTAERLLVARNRDVGLLVAEGSATAELADSTISGTRATGDSAGGLGVAAQDGGVVRLLSTAVIDCDGPGVYLVAQGALEARDTDLVGNGFAGAVVLDGVLDLRGGSLSASRFHPSEGGGVGILGWSVEGPPRIEADDVRFSDLAGPALYLRGPGSYLLSGCEVTDSGSWPTLPGGVMGVEGVRRRHLPPGEEQEVGLLVAGSTFDQLASDAILLDASSVTLDVEPDSGAANSFDDLVGEAVHWQRCTGVEAPEVLDGSVVAPECSEEARVLGPLLEYSLWLWETGVD